MNKQPTLSISQDKLSFNMYSKAIQAQQDNLLFLGNGFLGLYGLHLEKPNPIFLSGVYEEVPLHYRKHASGFPLTNQVILPLPYAIEIKAYLPNFELTLDSPLLSQYYKELNFIDGCVKQVIEWTLPQGILSIESLFILSFDEPKFGAIRHEAIWQGKENQPFMIEIGLTDTKESAFVKQFQPVAEDQILCTGKTKQSEIEFTLGMQVRSLSDAVITKKTKQTKDKLALRFQLNEGCHKLMLYQIITAATSVATDKENSYKQVIQSLQEAKAERNKFTRLQQKQKQHVKTFWEKSDVVITGNAKLQQAIRYAIFSLKQSVSASNFGSIATQGISNPNNNSYYSWEAEIFTLPHYIYTHPKIAKSMLLWRYSILEQAKQRAKELGSTGALFPCYTITGKECSPFYPAGTAQYHVNTAITYSIKKYVFATNDISFLLLYGAEILFETARFWLSLGSFSENKGFCINQVTGPDEYTALVNNNFYTNSMVQDSLFYTVDIFKQLQMQYTDDLKKLSKKINLHIEEVSLWEKAAKETYLPYDTDKGIYKQDDSFLTKEKWDIKTNKGKQALLLSYHPLILYRHQVLQQPNTLMSTFLLSHRINQSDMIRNFQYYKPLTTDDSYITPSIHAIVAAYCNDSNSLASNFEKTAYTDLFATYDKEAKGIHTGAMAGTWLALVYGGARFQDEQGNFSFMPKIPKQWGEVSFCLTLRNTVLCLEMTQDKVTYTLVEGESLSFSHYYKSTWLFKQQSISFSLLPKIEACILTLDGVITDTTAYHYQAWATLCEERNLQLSDVDKKALVTSSRKEALQLILSVNQVDWTNESKQEACQRKNQLYQDNIAKITANDILPHIQEFIAELKAADIKIAVASSSQNTRQVVENLGLLTQFDYIVNAKDIVKSKPDPEVFITAIENLQVPLENSVVIEDTEQNKDAIQAIGIFATTVDQTNFNLDSLKQAFQKAQNEMT